MENDFEQEQYQEPQQEEVSEGAPNPADYPDYDEYVGALVDHSINKAAGRLQNPAISQAEAVRASVSAAFQQQAQAQAQAQAQLPPFADDAKAGDREHWTKLSMNAGKEAIKAKESGDIQSFHDWRQRQRQFEAEIEKLGPTPEQEYVETLRDHEVEQAMKLLTDPNHANDSIWQHDRIKQDAPVAVIKANARAKTTLRLPLETSRHGTLLPCEPKNMVTVELDPNQMKRFKGAIDSLSPKEKEDPDAVLRKSWSILHRYGYSPMAKRVMDSKPGNKAEGEESDPAKMTFKEFCAWREKSEKPRQGFVFPKPVRGK